MRAYALALAAVVLLLAPAEGGGQQLTVESNLTADRFVSRDATIELRFNRPLDPAVERVAVFFGTTDATDLFERTPAGLRYPGHVLPLPSGESEVIVHLVSGDEPWREVARLPLRVLGRLGLEKARVDPTASLGLNSRIAQERIPVEPPVARPTYNDFAGQLQLDTEHVRGGTQATSRSTFVAASERSNALRFGELGDDAPLVDLSGYRLRLDRGALGVQVGDVAAGGQRHLINGFASRGVAVSVKPGTRVDASVAALSGSRVVGWENLVGLEEPDHRMLNATVGVEALARPGALRFELNALDGSILPRSGVNQGAVTDAEQSRGLGVRVQAHVTRLRLRLDGGFTRSSFTNPPDPLLAQGEDLVDVRAVTESARYLDANVELLRNRRLFGTRTARLSLVYGHERVDPLFRSVAAYTRADHMQNQLQLRGDVAGISVSAGQLRSRNNLDEVPSILTSKTERTSVDVGLPLATVLGMGTATWLPVGRYRFDRTHQFGVAVPTNGGFEPSHVPDQVSGTHNAALRWESGRVSWGIERNHTIQDNRQTGREDADFDTRATSLTLTLRPWSVLTLNADVGRVSAENVERGEVDVTGRYGAGLTWRPVQHSTLTLRYAGTGVSNAVRGSTRDDARIEAQWAAALPGVRWGDGTYFLRYARSTNTSLDPGLELDDRREHFWLDAGLNFSF